MGKSKKRGGGARKPQGRYISSAEEMRARDEGEVKQGKRDEADVLSDDANSGLEVMTGTGHIETEPLPLTEAAEKLQLPFIAPVAPLDASSLIQTTNPNRSTKKVAFATDNASEEQLPNREANAEIDEFEGLSRTQKEFILAKRENRKKEKLTREGLTEESKSDLERLEEIRKEREANKKRRELEKLKKEELKKKASERAQELESKAKKKSQKGRKKKGKK